MGEDETRYDVVVKLHNHFTCEECGKMCDIDRYGCKIFLKMLVDAS